MESSQDDLGWMPTDKGPAKQLGRLPGTRPVEAQEIHHLVPAHHLAMDARLKHLHLHVSWKTALAVTRHSLSADSDSSGRSLGQRFLDVGKKKAGL